LRTPHAPLQNNRSATCLSAEEAIPVESMTRAPFVMGKADATFSRTAKLEGTTKGWRFVNPIMKQRNGVEPMRGSGSAAMAEEFMAAL
jgi:hypothetical protein